MNIIWRILDRVSKILKKAKEFSWQCRDIVLKLVDVLLSLITQVERILLAVSDQELDSEELKSIPEPTVH